MLNVALTLLTTLGKIDPQPIWLVRFELASGAIYTFTSKDYVNSGASGQQTDVLTWGGHYPSIIDVKPAGAEKDPLTQEFTSGDIEVTVGDDGAARQMIYDRRLKGCAVYLYVGAVGVIEQDWMPCGAFIFQNHRCEEGQIVLECEDATGILLEALVEPSNRLQKHPLEIAEDTYVAAKVPTVLPDYGTFDPLQYQDTISHWCVRDDFTNPLRGEDRNTDRDAPPSARKALFDWHVTHGGAPKKWGDAQSAKQIISELAEACGGCFLPDEDFRTRFKRYDAARAVDRDLEAADIVELNHLGTTHNLTNRVAVSFGRDGGHKVTLQDTASAAAHVFPGETERFYDSEAKCAWANGEVPLGGNLFPGVTSLYLAGVGLAGFTGTRWEGNRNSAAVAATQRADWRLTSTRVAYYLIKLAQPKEELGYTDNAEIVKATAFVGDLTNLSFWNGLSNVNAGTFTIERAQFGTSGVLHLGDERVYDITIPIALAQQRLRRFAYGCPEIEVRVPLRHIDLQVGDFVTLPDSVLCWYQRKSITSATRWEVVRKEISLGDSPGVRLKLLVAVDAHMLPASSFGYTVPGGRGSKAAELEAMGRRSIFGRPHILSGFEVSDTGAGLEIELSAGVAATTASLFETSAAIKLTVKPSRDSYVYVDPSSRSFQVIDVATGASAPTTPTGVAPVAKVAAGAATLSSITSLRDTKALDGDKLKSASVPTTAAAAETSGLAASFTIRKLISAGGGGAADDATVYSSLPFAVRVVDSSFIVTAAVGGSTAQLRDNTGGLGKALSDAFSGATAGRQRDSQTPPTGTENLAAGDSIYLRRSDSGIAGYVVIHLVKI